MAKGINHSLSMLIGLVIGWCSIGFSNKIYWVALWDEANYANAGLKSIVTINHFGLSGIVYGILSLFISDPAYLVLTGQAFLYTLGIAALSLTVSFASRSYFLVILITAAAIVVDQTIGPAISPKPAIFQYFLGVSILIFSLSQTDVIKNKKIRDIFIGLSTIVMLWCTGYARYESFLSLLVLSAILFILGMSIMFVRRKVCWTLFATAGLALLVYSLIVGKLIPRTWTAFGQHYSYRLSLKGELMPGEMPFSDWRKIIQRDFGDAETIAQAIVAAPFEVGQHILENGMFLLEVLIGKAPLMLGCMVVFVVVAVLKIKKIALDEGGIILLVLPLALLTPFIATSLVGYPRDYYLPIFTFAVSSLVIAVAWICRFDFRHHALEVFSLPLFVVILISIYNYHGSNSRDTYMREIYQKRLFMIENTATYYVWPGASGKNYLLPTGREIREYPGDIKERYDNGEPVCIIVRDYMYGRRSEIGSAMQKMKVRASLYKSEIFCNF